ncbi:phosphate signaling complex protein PhoU [Nocardioides panacis]|jgi:phosphate transport system protein|uniref:Phosphate-specific transport system accessory protein PhoU n=1 Tax=Nocardioides panacis TaxID=2849501 RepID=A0A975SZL5_9ACTN|nr:phosphate signaling complex protein PhoU [Nocardioides panacis]QWZ08154.1 phosphate signaling complex protein PhoU [Nocardioides panacis]
MRNAYFDQLDSIVDELVDMTHVVKVAVSLATQALLTADAEIAEKVISDDAAIDAARERVEERSFELLALQQPVASDLRMLVAALRMVADLERMGDLSVHVAKVARLRVPQVAVPAEIVPTIERMATVAEKMVDTVAGIIAERDVEGARQLEEDDEEMDQLRRSSFRLMLDDSWPHGVEPAVDIALLGRYYERIADHAVSLARRVVYLVTGETVTTVDHL